MSISTCQSPMAVVFFAELISYYEKNNCNRNTASLCCFAAN